MAKGFASISAEDRKRFSSMGGRAAHVKEPDLRMEAPQHTQRYSMLELIKCAEREVQQRKRVYPRLIEQGKMSRAFADAEIGRMQAIVDRLRKQAGAEGWAV